jgi:hypothetical protein
MNIEDNSGEIKIETIAEELNEFTKSNVHYDSDIEKDLENIKNDEKVDLSCLKDMKIKEIVTEDISPYTHDSLNQSEINFRRDTANYHNETSIMTPRGAEFTNYNKEIKLFLEKLKVLFKNNHFVVNWLSRTYNWIEDRFIKKEIIREAKTTVQVSENNKINKPEVKRKCKDLSHLKQRSTILKTAGNNFSILLNMIMGIRLSVLATNNITLQGNGDLSQYFRKSKHTLPSLTFYSSEVEGVSFL